MSKLNFNFMSKVAEKQVSLKKVADCEVINKFSDLNSEIDKNLIANIPLKYSKKQFSQDKADEFIFKAISNIKIPAKALDQVAQEKVLKQKKTNYYFAFRVKVDVEKSKHSGSPLRTQPQKRGQIFSQTSA